MSTILYHSSLRLTLYEYNAQGLLTKQQTGPAVSTGSSITLGSVVLKREYVYSTTPAIFGALVEESDGINSPIRYFYDSSSGRLLASLQNGEGLTYILRCVLLPRNVKSAM